ncbi:hypothetical protein L596_007147 [Steinernema carpocapsae]|uniref:Mediator of RNA polymerase II transcription subunit 23 n=1 Tax=Steinernema carpocapsae TaxID=34508 RepID=A0A4U5P8D2_STECR|nr:hypothetical protein L596_007147 [Steinernema carpocapsae]
MLQQHLQHQQAHLQALAAVASTSGDSRNGRLENQNAAASEEVAKMDEGASIVDVDRLRGLGSEVEKLRWLVRAHVEGSEIQAMFFDVSVDTDPDEIACVEAVKLLKRIPRVLRDHACSEMIKLLHKDSGVPKMEECDRLIMKIIRRACENEVITLLQACEQLLSSIDFTMKTIPINREKVDFIAAKFIELDYKGIRNILKMIVENLGRVPPHLTDTERAQMAPVETLFLELIDRKKNHSPALFVITEITRMSNNSCAYMMPRIARKITDIVSSFRPLAEITTMIARSWLFPITAHVNFNVNQHTWKVQDILSPRLYLKGHLPFNNESVAPQTYLQYILLKQPRNQDVIPFIVRSNNSSHHPKLQCDDMIPILIIESMRAMETTEYALEADENQYTWRQIAHLFISCLYSNHASFNKILQKLHMMLKSHNYRVARAELMWVLLQFVAIRIDQLSEDEMKGVEELYKLLYEDEPTWSGCSTDFHRMARFFGPAAIWVQFNKRASMNSSIKVPPVPDNLKGIVEQIQCHTNYNFGDALVAVAGNAWTSNDKMFQERVIDVIRPTLDAQLGEDPWPLPFNRRATGRITSLDINLLDAFTFRAKDNLIRYLLDTLNAYASTAGARLPSPACIDTLVRIAMTLEYQFGLLPIHKMLHTSKGVMNIDLFYMVTEMLNYRLVGCRIPVPSRCALIQHVYLLMGQILNSPGTFASSIPGGAPQQRTNWPLTQLYMAFEQLIMRHALWVPPNELAPFNTSLLAIRVNDGGAFCRALTHPELFNMSSNDPQGHVSWICPEITSGPCHCLQRNAYG